MPFVSILIPAYNAQAFINEAIESALNQTYGNFEILVCDDGSTDDTSAVITYYCQKSEKVRHLVNTVNLGIAKTRNKLLDMSKGKYIAWLDADDVADKNRIKLQVDFLESNSQIFAVGAGRILIDNNGQIIRPLKCASFTNSHEFNFLNIIFRNLYCNSTMMMRTTEERFDLGYPPAEDYEFWSRLILLKNYRIVNLNLPLVKYRVHQNNSSTRNLTRQLSLNDSIISRNVSSQIGFHLSGLSTVTIHHHLSAIFCLKNGFLGYIAGTLSFFKILNYIRKNKKIPLHFFYYTIIIDSYYRLRAIVKFYLKNIFRL